MSDPGWSTKKCSVFWAGSVMIVLVITIAIVVMALSDIQSNKERAIACTEAQGSYVQGVCTWTP